MNNKMFNPLISSVLTIMGGSGLLVFSIQDGKPLMIVLGGIILISGVGMLFSYCNGKK